MAPRGATTLKVLAVTPGLLGSTVLTCLVGAVLPPLPGLIVFLGALALLALLSAGRLEGVGVRVLCRARPTTQREAATLALAVILLRRQGVDPSTVRLHLRDDPDVAAAAPVGRRSVLVTSGLVRDLQQGRLGVWEAAALMAHAVGAVRLGLTRCDLAITYWTLPWQLVTAVCRPVARALAGLPLVRFAWRVRVVVAAVAVAQSVVDGRPAAGAVVGVVVALTYLGPRWRRAWERRLLFEGDRFVFDHDLGHQLAAHLRTSPASDVTLARIRHLAGPPEGPALPPVAPQTQRSAGPGAPAGAHAGSSVTRKALMITSSGGRKCGASRH